MDLKGETEQTKKSYGLDAEFHNTGTFGRNCLIARRLVERGVRFIQLTCPGGNGDRWDQHGGLKAGHEKMPSPSTNPSPRCWPISKLAAFSTARCLSGWANSAARRLRRGVTAAIHNPFRFSLWMAGGGVKGGTVYGGTDEYGYKAVDKRLEIHDLHATMLHLLGMDHTKLTIRFSSRDMRLTDVHGEVIKDILA